MNSVKEFLKYVDEKNKGEEEFIQAVTEVLTSVYPFIQENKKYQNIGLLERLIEPERTIIFRVPWVDDKGIVNVNRGYRVEMNSAIGPYKGGLRFHPSINMSILKFLSFEQCFKNSLTTLNLGGGKGGADFNPKGKSEGEVMRFCQSFMMELFRHIGAHTDVPAGDIGVGEREIGYLFGMYKKLTNEFSGTLTGKGIFYGGSHLSPEATGYGLVYFVENMLLANNNELRGKKAIVSGSGNVAQYTVEKWIEQGAIPITLSDSDGFIYDKNGINTEKLEFVKNLKTKKRGRIKEYVQKYKEAYYYTNKSIWSIKSDIALPCATQNELKIEDAKQLVKNKILCIAEGANMPCTNEAIEYFQKNKIIYAPGKASNAGGVALSGLEMSQNSLRMQWSKEEVNNKLKDIMKSIHEKCIYYGTSKNNTTDYVKGANVGGFVKIADAMISQGII